MIKKEDGDYEKVISSYYGEGNVTALINLKVDTKEADNVATEIAKLSQAEEVHLVTGDTDIVVKANFANYKEYKEFLLKSLATINGVKDTKTSMVIATYKSRALGNK